MGTRLIFTIILILAIFVAPTDVKAALVEDPNVVRCDEAISNLVVQVMVAALVKPSERDRHVVDVGLSEALAKALEACPDNRICCPSKGALGWNLSGVHTILCLLPEGNASFFPISCSDLRGLVDYCEALKMLNPGMCGTTKK